MSAALASLSPRGTWDEAIHGARAILSGRSLNNLRERIQGHGIFLAITAARIPPRCSAD
jgi:hypothetical protein